MVTSTVRLGRALQSHSGFQGFVLDIKFCLEILDTSSPSSFLRPLAKPDPAVSLVCGVIWGYSLPSLVLSAPACESGAEP